MWGEVVERVRQTLRACLGETIRILFGIGGPNFSSSFHLVGKDFDRVEEAQARS